MKSLFCALFLAVFTVCQAQAMTGEDVLMQQQERHAVASARCSATMLLKDGRGNEESRTLTLLTRETSEVRHFLAVFQAPEDIKGTALLAEMPAQGESSLFLYLPAAGDLQRVSGSSKKNAFMGSDFTYEDLEPEPIENFQYEILRSEVHEGQNCWVIEAVPADRNRAKASAYARRVLWITKAHMATLRVEFFDRRDRLLKTLVNKDIMVWRPRVSIMEDARTGHTTTISLLGQEEINIELDDSLFSPEALKEQAHCP